MIRIKNGKKQFDQQVIFEHLDFEIHSAGIHVIQGESGSGKTTLLNIIAGFEPLDKGERVIQGRMAVIFQNYELIDEMTVRENIYLPLKLFQQDCLDNEKEILDILELNELLDFYPNELSGGQRQRVGIARALFQRPEVILCDEPTESLDIENKKKVLDLFQSVSKKVIIIMVTHDLKLIENYYDFIYQIENKTVCLLKSRQANPVSYDEKADSVHIFQLQKVVSQLMMKRTVIYSLMVSVLMILFLILLVIDQNMFSGMRKQNAIVRNRVYLEGELYPDDEDEELELIPVNKIDSLHCEGHEYRIKILPSDKESLSSFLVEGNVSDDISILVNETLANRLGEDCIGKKVILTYEIQKESYTVESRVAGIVQEDLYSSTAYFLEEEFEKYLMQVNTYDDMIQYDAFLAQPSLYQLDMRFETISAFYNSTFDGRNVTMIQPLLDQIEQEIKDKAIYHKVFQIMEGLCWLGMVLLVVVLTDKEMQKRMKACSILASLGSNTIILRILLVLMKTGCFTIIYGGVIYVYMNVSNDLIGVTSVRYLITGLWIIQFIAFCFSTRRLRKSAISKLLKNSED